MKIFIRKIITFLFIPFCCLAEWSDILEIQEIGKLCSKIWSQGLPMSGHDVKQQIF